MRSVVGWQHSTALATAIALVAAIGHAATGWSGRTIGPAGTDLNAVYFSDAQHGWVGGDAGFLSSTDDGGMTWMMRNAGTTGAINDVAFTSIDTGFVLAGAAILDTRDGGRSWRAARTFLPAEFAGAIPELYSLHFTNRTNGWVVGSASRGDRVTDTILVSTEDGGTTWRVRAAPARRELVHVMFVDDRHGWLTGADGAILHTGDGGTTWAAQTTGTTNFLYHVAFRNEREGWAVGERGTILRTIDGGRTWTPTDSPVRSTLLSVQLANKSDGWIIGRGGVILRSADSGRTWVGQESTTKQHLYGLFVDERGGWVSGGDGLILRYRQ